MDIFMLKFPEELQKVRGPYSFRDRPTAPMKQSPCPAGLGIFQAPHTADAAGNYMALWSGKAHKPPQHRCCGARRFGAAANRSRVTAQRAVEDYILRLI